MKYNYLTKVPVVAEEASTMADMLAGLELSAELIVKMTVTVNTELPEMFQTELTNRVTKYLSDKTGQAVEVTLVSTEN